MSMKPTVKEKELLRVASDGPDAFLDYILEITREMIGGELTAEWMGKLNAQQITMLAYDTLRCEVMDGGFVQLIHNGYGPFIFFNPTAKAMKEWGLTDLSKLIYRCYKPFRQHQEEIERDCTDEEFMAMFEKYGEFDEFDDEFVENEEEWTEEVARFVDEHLDDFVTILKDE